MSSEEEDSLESSPPPLKVRDTNSLGFVSNYSLKRTHQQAHNSPARPSVSQPGKRQPTSQSGQYAQFFSERFTRQLKRDVSGLEEEISKKDAIIRDLQSQVGSASAKEVDDLLSQLAEMEDELNNISRQLDQERESKQRIQEQLNDVNTQAEELAAIEEDRDQLQTELDNQKAQLLETETQNQEYASKIDSLQEELSRNSSSCERHITEIDGLNAKIQNLEIELRDAKDGAEITSGENQDLRNDLAKLENDALLANQNIEKLKLEITEKENLVSTRDTEVAALKTQLKNYELNVEDRNKMMKTKVDSLNSQLEAANSEKNSLKGRLEVANEKLSAKTQDFDKLHEENQRFKNQEIQVTNAMQNMEAQIQEKTAEIDRISKEYEDLATKKQELENDLEETASLFTQIKQFLHNCQEELRNQCDLNQVCKLDYENAPRENATLSGEYDKVHVDINASEGLNYSTHEKFTETSNALGNLKTDHAVLTTTLTGCQQENQHLKSKLNERNNDVLSKGSSTQQLKQAEDLLVSYKNKYHEERAHTRQLQDYIQTLKGNIRMIARVRPSPNASTYLQLTNSKVNVIEQVNRYNGVREKSWSVEFDRVFGPQAQTAEICEETESIITSVTRGHNGLIFAYGQTGSGKTHTMGGPNGVTSYAVKKIMRFIQDQDGLDNEGYRYECELTAVEIYNEMVIDLLAPEDFVDTRGYNDNSKRLSTRPAANNTATIQLNSSKMPELNNTTIRHVDSYEEAINVFNQANNTRSTASTNANEHSSRSHLVFTIKLKKIKRDDPSTTTYTCLNLVDLAGSERLSQSLAQGTRLKETQAINTSLSALGKVINALIANNPNVRVPYRDSKLTYLLQGSLSGSSKVMVLITITPEQEHQETTKGTLKFAERTSKATINE